MQHVFIYQLWNGQVSLSLCKIMLYMGSIFAIANLVLIYIYLHFIDCIEHKTLDC